MRASASAQVGGGSGGAAETVVIYEPSIGSTTGNRYKTWTEVMAAVAAIIGPVEIQLRNATPGNGQVFAVSDAGPHDLSKCKLTASPENILPALQFADGVTLSGFPFQIEGVSIENGNLTNPLFTVATAMSCKLLNAVLVNNGTTPLILVPPTKTCTLWLEGLENPIIGGDSSEPIEVHGALTVNAVLLKHTGFFVENDVFTNNNDGDGDITINSHVLLQGGYTGTHANYDSSLNLVQLEEARVNQLVASAIAGLQTTGDTVVSAASNFVFTGTTAPSGILNPNQYKWRQYSGGLFGFAAVLGWSVAGSAITKFTCEFLTQINPVTYPGFSSMSVPKYFHGTVGDGSAWYPCLVRFYRENNNVPAVMEVTMDTPINITYFHCDFTYRFSP